MDDAKALAAALENLTPDQARQRDFLVELCDNIKESMLERVAKMPPEWDGHELRMLLNEYTRRCVTHVMMDRRSKRVRAFEAHCLTYNLY